MKKLILPSLIILVAGTLTYIKKQKQLLDHIGFAFKNFKINIIDFITSKTDKLFGNFNLVIKNKGVLKLKASKIYLKLYIDDIYLIDIKHTASFEIKPKSETIINLSFDFIPENIQQILANIKLTNVYLKKIRLKGRINIIKFQIINIRLPIDLNYTVSDLLL